MTKATKVRQLVCRLGVDPEKKGRAGREGNERRGGWKGGEGGRSGFGPGGRDEGSVQNAEEEARGLATPTLMEA